MNPKFLLKQRLFFATALLIGVYGQVTTSDGMTADSHCGNGYCITAIYSASNRMVNYTLVVPKGGMQIGWYGIGQGTKMAGSNMAINWVNADNSLTTSHRGAKGTAMPQENEVTIQPFSINTDVSKTREDLTIWSWNWPLQQGRQSSQPHIFAMTTQSPITSQSGTAIHKHTSDETNIFLDLTKPYGGETPAGLSGQATTISSSSSNSVDDGEPNKSTRDLSRNTTRIYFLHMMLMVLAWMLFFPLGIFLARFGRALFPWFSAHRGVQLFGFFLVFIAFFLVIAAVSIADGSHFSNTHGKLGLALFMLLIAQVLLGFLAHDVRARTKKRFVGFLHIPLGLLLFALSVWQIHKGFSIWEWSPPSAASYIIYAWAGICVFAYCIGMFFIPHQIRKTHSCEISAKQGQRGAGGDD